MIWIFYALLSAVFSSISTIVRKKTLLKEHTITFLAVNKIFQLIIVCIIIPFIDLRLAVTTYAFIIVVAILAVEGDIFWTKALKRLNVSFAAPLTNISPAIVVILAYFMLNEAISWIQLIGVILIIAGAYVLEADHGITKIKTVYNHLKKSKYTLVLILSLLIGSFVSIGERYIIGNNFVKPRTMLFLMYLFTTIFAVSFQLNDNRGMQKIKKTIKRAKLAILITAVTGLLTTGFYYLAIKEAYISLVMPILLISTLLTTIIGGELFKEKNIFYKTISCIIMIIGVFLIIGTSI